MFKSRSRFRVINLFRSYTYSVVFHFVRYIWHLLFFLFPFYFRLVAVVLLFSVKRSKMPKRNRDASVRHLCGTSACSSSSSAIGIVKGNDSFRLPKRQRCKSWFTVYSMFWVVTDPDAENAKQFFFLLKTSVYVILKRLLYFKFEFQWLLGWHYALVCYLMIDLFAYIFYRLNFF